jgi:hypothetical protein
MSQPADRLPFRVLAGNDRRPGIGLAERTRAVVDPDVVVRVDEDAADVADDPIVREHLWPGGVEHEAWCRASLGAWRALSQTFEHMGVL